MKQAHKRKAADESATPAIRREQFPPMELYEPHLSMKGANRDALLAWECASHFLFFSECAVIVSRELHIPLTVKQGPEGTLLWCSVRREAMDASEPVLLKSGYSIAYLDQKKQPVQRIVRGLAVIDGGRPKATEQAGWLPPDHPAA